MGAFARIGLLVGLILAGAGGASAEPATKTYAEWVAMAEAGDPATDFTALRMAYVHSPGFDAHGETWATLEEELFKADEAHDCATKLKVAGEIVKLDYTDIVAHAARADCLRQQGDSRGADHEMFVLTGLANSVMHSGDGKSQQSAYVVVTSAEERFVLIQLDVRDVQKTLVSEVRPYCERLDGRDLKTGNRVSIYFNIDEMLSRVMRNLEELDKKNAK